jgi:HEAT repeat protein
MPGWAAAAVPTLAGLLRSPDLPLAQSAEQALRGMGPAAAEAVPAALEVLKDAKRPPAIRTGLVVMLGAIGPGAKAAVPALVELLKDDSQDEGLRRQAAESLGRIGPGARDALPALLGLSRTIRPSLRVPVLNAAWLIDRA